MHVPCNLVAKYIYIYKANREESDEKAILSFCEIEIHSPTLSLSHLHAHHAQVLDSRSGNIVNEVSGHLLSQVSIPQFLASPLSKTQGAYEMILRWPLLQGRHNFNRWTQTSNPTNLTHGLTVQGFNKGFSAGFVTSYAENGDGQPWGGLVRNGATSKPSPLLHDTDGYFAVGFSNFSIDDLWHCGMRGPCREPTYSVQFLLRRAWVDRDSHLCSTALVNPSVKYEFGFVTAGKRPSVDLITFAASQSMTEMILT